MCKFKENIAISCGIKAAIVAQFIWDNIKLGSYDGNVYEAEGKTWCRCSMLMMTGFFPFMTKKMRRIKKENFGPGHSFDLSAPGG